MNDQANRYANALNVQALGGQQQAAQQSYGGTRLSKVWIALYDDDKAPIAVFASKAAADVFMAGAKAGAAEEGSIILIELPVTYV